MLTALQAIYADMSNTRPKVDLLRDCAVDLSTKGQRISAFVEAELTEVNARWQRSMDAIRVFSLLLLGGGGGVMELRLSGRNFYSSLCFLAVWQRSKDAVRVFSVLLLGGMEVGMIDLRPR